LHAVPRAVDRAARRHAACDALVADAADDDLFIAQNNFRRGYGSVTRKWQDVGLLSELGVLINAEHKRTPEGATLLNAVRFGTYGNGPRASWVQIEPRYEQVRVI